jgi:predicted dehydrogenase
VSDTVVRIGIVGAGAVTSGSHLPALARIPGVQVVWLCDRNLAGARAVAARWNVPAVFDDLAACPTVDAVLVATPVATRPAIVPALIERGMHVFCEKPFALSTEEHERYLTLARARNVQLAVAQMRRYAAATATAASLVRRQAFGRLLRIAAAEGQGVRNTGRGSEWHLTDASVRTGVLLETGSHLVDQVQWIADAARIEVTDATQRKGRGIELESDLSLAVTLGDGRTIPGRVQLSMLRDLPNGIFLEFERATLFTGLFFGDPLRIIDADGRTVLGLEKSEGTDNDGDSFVMEWLDFLSQVRTGQPSRIAAETVRLTTSTIADAYDRLQAVEVTR